LLNSFEKSLFASASAHVTNNIASLRSFIKTLKVIEHNANKAGCHFESKGIHAGDTRHYFRGLQNNIILDANGDFEALYDDETLAKTKFIRETLPNLIDYNNSDITRFSYNTSKNSLKGNEREYFSEMIAHILENKEATDRIFIVLRKEYIQNENGEDGLFIEMLKKIIDSSDIFVGVEAASNENVRVMNNESFAVNWFGNIVGRNEWRN